MRISADYIGFDSLGELNRFVQEQDLINNFELAEPVKDKAGNILIKDKILVKESLLKRLEAMEDNYDPDFRVSLTDELVKKLRTTLTKYIVSLLTEPKNVFIAHLFQKTQVHYTSNIQNAFSSKMLLLTFYKQYTDSRAFFDHAASLGLLALGVIVQRSFGIPRLHRYAFLGGFAAQLPLASSEEWMHPIPEVRKKELTIASSKLAARLGMAPEIVEALKATGIEVDKPAEESSPLEIIDPDAPRAPAPQDKPSAKDGAAEPEAEGEDPKPGAPADPAGLAALTAVLRLTLFIHEAGKEITDPSKFSEKIITMVAYNGARGYFHPDLVEMMISRFTEYEKIARKMIAIAQLEKRCIYPPSAWAYPKPRAAQILCRGFITHCPHCVGGWDIHVVSPQEAYGWLGTSLDAGNYPKCSLEKDLDRSD